MPSESVNYALHSPIDLIPEKRASQVAENRGRYGRKELLGGKEQSLPVPPKVGKELEF